MSTIHPLALLGIGFFLLILGFALPVLMIMQLLESTFFLNFFAFTASFLGLVIGFVGSVLYVASNRRK